MAITEKSVINKIEILENGQIQVQRADLVLRDGVEIARTYHRHVLAPGDDVTQEDPRVQAHAKAAWTDEVAEEYKETQAANAFETKKAKTMKGFRKGK